MTAPVILNQFSDEHPFSVTELNIILAALAGAINALAGTQMVALNPAGGTLNTDYVPSTGGDYLGVITAPAMQIGPAGGTKHPVVTQGTPASATEPGAVFKGAAVATLTQTISGTYVKAEIDAIQTTLNALITSLKNAGAIA